VVATRDSGEGMGPRGVFASVVAAPMSRRATVSLSNLALKSVLSRYTHGEGSLSSAAQAAEACYPQIPNWRRIVASAGENESKLEPGKPVLCANNIVNTRTEQKGT